jgi:hypothetical protein
MTHGILPKPTRECSSQAGSVVGPQAAAGDLAAAAAPAAAIGVWPFGASSGALALDDVLAYQRDAFERTLLFWDTLRQRADNMIAHERAGKPPLLDFDHELILDARRFERPVNYALLRITRSGDKCLEDCLDPAKPPVMIVDPRAGHGPGIGGFKRDSEVGIAMHAGHPVYFVVFYPEPSPGQTMADVLHVLRRFAQEVLRRHQGKPPILYGNCQAGWAIAILAADCQGLTGPAVLNGSPLSYWAGESGVNPARVSAGLLGGAWLTHLAADLGNGRFDGAWLVQNFENLKPEGVWEKYANLFSHIDDERERFLEFERWWNGFYFLSREEMLAIVENLFIGNDLEQGKLRICPDCTVDLRLIRNPLVIFASHGDNITPPHQALGWIPAVYAGTDDLKQAGQRIVYLINPKVGHLGIFVSASVARLEHRAILHSLKRIEALAPGLYEMKIDKATGDADCGHDAYSVRFEERRVEDLRFPENRAAFERVAELSDQWNALYSATLGKCIEASSTPLSAQLLEWLHPMRVSRYAFATDFNPWLRALAPVAASVARDRHAAAKTNALKLRETEALGAVGDLMTRARELRDWGYEFWFEVLYGRGLASADKKIASEKAIASESEPAASSTCGRTA